MYIQITMAPAMHPLGQIHLFLVWSKPHTGSNGHCITRVTDHLYGCDSRASLEREGHGLCVHWSVLSCHLQHSFLHAHDLRQALSLLPLHSFLDDLHCCRFRRCPM